MSLAIIFSRASAGISAPLVTVETHLANGMAGFHIVGLPATAVKESRDRVRSALVNTEFEFPIKHITVNLAPADLPKEGGRFDLPIALGILAASGQLPSEALHEYEFIGELALSGELRPVKGVLPIVLAAHQAGRKLILPKQNAAEAALTGYANIFPASHLLEVCAHLRNHTTLSSCQLDEMQLNGQAFTQGDLSDVKGQAHAKQALQIAAAGKHSLLFVGPPGTGKTMLASRLTTLLPSLTEQQALEIAAISSVSNSGFNAKQWKQIPFRAPHHSTSSVALVGGGRPPKPGEISLAHHGVLFLDELPEFHRHVLECLREPLESGVVTISRASFQMNFPAAFQFIAAMNPCPCGYAGNANQCTCSLEQIKRYIGKISGPLLDRIDMQVQVARLPPAMLDQASRMPEESSAKLREKILAAIERQQMRQKKLNSQLNVAELSEVIQINEEAKQLLNQVMTKFNLSARVYHRLLKIGLTIADLAVDPVIERKHIAEALQFRSLDKISSFT